MSTPTPTGNGDGGHANGHARSLGKLASWTPDEAALAKLAADVLASLADDSQADGMAGNRPESASAPAGQAAPSPPQPAAPQPAMPRPTAPRPAMPQPSFDLAAYDPARLGSAKILPLLPAEPDAMPTPAIDPAGQPTFYFVDERPEPDLRQAQGNPAPAAFNVDAVRRDFPVLGERVNGKPLVWLDNAATTQKPQPVIDRLARFYSSENSNIHRGAHALATQATESFEDARSKVASFLGASSSDDIIFTRGTTEAINLVAQTWGRAHVGPGDEILVSHLEHHANIVPWQLLADETGAKLKVIAVDDSGQLLLDSLGDQLSDRTKLVAVAHVSNVLGTIVPVDQVIAAAHRAGARVLIDGAQAVAHLPVDVQRLDADFYTFSGHKVFAPTGIGALYAKPEVLEEMPPWQGGGNMISDVTFERTVYQNSPAKFEAGTGNIADAIGLGAALDYVNKLGLASIGAYEHQLLEYATRQICAIPGLRLLGTAPEKASVLTFVLDGHEPGEVGQALDRQGIAVRAGHHCAQPILRRYGFEAAVRPSLAMYNTCTEVDQLISALYKITATR